MAEVTWFKVLTDIFSDDKIKIIQSMPEGDSLLVMWFKVLAQAGKTNDGGYIYLKKDMPYTAGMLSTLFNKPQQIVEMALKTFNHFEMIDIDENGYIFVTNWEKHQSIDKLNKIKEQTRLRVQTHRAKKQQELLESSATVTLPSRSDNATEVDIEKEKDTTTDDEADFRKVNDAYARIHGKRDIESKCWPLVTKLLREGIPADLMVETMEQRHKEKVEAGETVSGFGYYEHVFRDRFKQKDKPNRATTRQRPADPELEARRREIARNQWIEEGNDPNEFEYRPASNA